MGGFSANGVLMVDDDSSIRELLAMQLEEADCLRTFRATSTPGNKRVDRTAVCLYCQARVPFLIESSEPA